MTETRLRDKRSASVLEAPIRKLEVAAYTVPTDTPEADGTLTWDSTTMVVVHAHAGDACGMGGCGGSGGSLAH